MQRQSAILKRNYKQSQRKGAKVIFREVSAPLTQESGIEIRLPIGHFRLAKSYPGMQVALVHSLPVRSCSLTAGLLSNLIYRVQHALSPVEDFPDCRNLLVNRCDVTTRNPSLCHGGR